MVGWTVVHRKNMGSRPYGKPLIFELTAGSLDESGTLKLFKLKNSPSSLENCTCAYKTQRTHLQKLLTTRKRDKTLSKLQDSNYWGDPPWRDRLC